MTRLKIALLTLAALWLVGAGVWWWLQRSRDPIIGQWRETSAHGRYMRPSNLEVMPDGICRQVFLHGPAVAGSWRTVDGWRDTEFTVWAQWEYPGIGKIYSAAEIEQHPDLQRKRKAGLLKRCSRTYVLTLNGQSQTVAMTSDRLYLESGAMECPWSRPTPWLPWLRLAIAAKMKGEPVPSRWDPGRPYRVQIGVTGEL